MTNHAILDPRMLKIANELQAWARDFLTADNAEVKRPYSNNQTVCPFVRESMERNFFYQSFHPNIGPDERCIESIMLGYIDEFQRLPPFDPPMKFKKSLLVIFPDIAENQVNVLDLVQENIKNEFVQAGLMVGQFHVKCEVQGIHNPAFRPSRAPYPLLAIRNMEVHDIIFLSDWKHQAWFAEYDARYGERFKEPGKFDDLSKALFTYYVKARDTSKQKANAMVG